MPTTRPRHFVTESDELAAALDDASTRWPTLSRSQLLVRLALEASRTSRQERDERRRRRLAVLRTRSGLLTGAYEPGHLEHLRRDWPE